MLPSFRPAANVCSLNAAMDRRTLREAVAAADSFTEVLHRFELRSAGGNFQQLNVWLARWAISTEHFTHGGGPARAHTSQGRSA